MKIFYPIKRTIMRNQLLISVCAVSLLLTLLIPVASAATAIVNADYDGSVATGIDGTYSQMRAAAGTSVYPMLNGTTCIIRSNATTGFYDEQWRGLVTFNATAAGIPSDATINSAVVSVYGRDQSNQLGDLGFSIVEAHPLSKTSYVADDYSRTTLTRFAPDKSYASYDNGGWNNFSLNSAGLTNISKTGLTTFMFTTSADVDNVTPPTWIAMNLSGFEFWGTNNTAGMPKPVMTVVYTPSALPVLTVSASPTTVTAGTPTNVNFTVRNATSTLPVSGALVTLTGVAGGSGTTGADGNATILVNAGSPGAVTATASLTGYTNGTATVTATAPLPVLTVSANQTSVTAGTPTGVNFTVINATSTLPVSGALVTLTGAALGSSTTGVDGTATFSVNATGAGTITATASLTGYTSGTTTVTANPAPGTLIPDKIGISQNGLWYLDSNGNGAFDSGVDKVYSFGGAPGYTAITGDWNATGFTDIGVYKDGVWYLDWNGNGAWDGGDRAYSFGAPGWMNVTGDWNGDGKTDIGVTNGQQWYLDMNNNGVYDSGVDRSYNFGAPGWTPIVGDWNATGSTYIGVTNGQQWYLDWNGDGTWTGADKVYSFGAPGWIPIVGVWNATGTKIGVTNGQQWYLDWNGNGAFDSGVDKAYSFGAPGWIPIVGDWNATGFKYIGVTNGQQWYLDWNGNGAFDSGVDKTYNFGAPGWAPVLGKWV
jgi:hypothetical protein